jgi:hypothetical protein
MLYGRPVPGAKGSCPEGSTWSETSGDGEFQMADVGDFLKKRYMDKEGGINAGTAAMDALIFVPGFGWMARGALTAGKVGAKGIGSLINKAFMKTTKAKPAKTTTSLNPNTLKPNPVQAPHWGINAQGQKIRVPFKPGSQFKPYNARTTRQTAPATPAGIKFAPGKSSVVAGTGLALNEQFGMPLTQSGQEAMANRQTASTTSQVPIENPVDPAALAEQTALAEKQRVDGLGFFDRMKEPGYWDTSLTGVEGDDRMSRLGDLLRYYGMPPSGRANELSPSEQWAQRSIDAATVAAKEAANNTIDTPYSKVGNKTLETAVTDKVKQDYGNTWIPGDVMFGGKLDKEGVASVAAIITANIVTLSKMPGNQGLPFDALYEQAKLEYEKNL